MKQVITLLIVLLSFFASSAQNNPPTSMQDWHYPYDVHHLRLPGQIDLAYADEGAGEQTLLFIHGLGSYLKAWSKNIDVLKEHHRCIALDLPGYGKSNKDEYPYDMSFFAETVRAFIDSLGLKNVVLVGHSMGGQVAMHTVLRSDKNIEKLILIAPAGFETFTDSERQWLQAVYTAQVIKATPEAQIVKNFEINFHSMPDDARFMIDDRLFMRQTVEYDRYCEMIPQCVKGMLDEPVFDRLPEIGLPTLVIFGENDLLIPNRLLHASLTPLAVAESGHQRIPHSVLKMVPEAGHFVQWEQAEAVNGAVLEFLK